MKLFNGNFRVLNRYFCLNQKSYTTEIFPYTSELYKKNYIKYKVQSKTAICHDYVYHGEERLPTLEERLKGENLAYFIRK